MNSAALDQLRHEANARLDPSNKGSLGQFMTPAAIAEFMANLFTNTNAAILLDAGAGIGSLSIAANQFLELQRIEAWEVDSVMRSYLEKNLESLAVSFQLHSHDFIHDSVNNIQFNLGTRFTHAILNPPYKKISSDSAHRLACHQVGIETVNLYTAFIALAILQMERHGELVAIIPRSFCNGPYYKPFRQLLLNECSIDVIHVFESRSKAFADDAVLQENIIIKLTRGKPQANVLLSFSPDASFSGLQQREIAFEKVVNPTDDEQFIRIPSSSDLKSALARWWIFALKNTGAMSRSQAQRHCCIRIISPAKASSTRSNTKSPTRCCAMPWLTNG
jgi:adenine-specific DNA-methyltransferase